MCNTRYNLETELKCHAQICESCSHELRDRKWHIALFYVGAFALGVCFMKAVFIMEGVIQ